MPENDGSATPPRRARTAAQQRADEAAAALAVPAPEPTPEPTPVPEPEVPAVQEVPETPALVKRAPVKRTAKQVGQAPAGAPEVPKLVPATKVAAKKVAAKAPVVPAAPEPVVNEPALEKAPAKKAVKKVAKAVETPIEKPLPPVETAAAPKPVERAWSEPSGSTTSLPPVQPGIPITKTHVVGAVGVLGLLLALRRRRKRRKG